ncbi:MAG: type II CAAX endopeptidase family protein [Terriglobia bacterium]
MSTSSRPLILAERETPFWGFGELFLSVAVFFVGLGVVVSVASRLLNEDAKTGYGAVLQEFAAYMILFALLKALFSFHGRPLLQSLGWVPQPFAITTLMGIGFAVFFLSIALAVILQTPETQTPFDKLINGDAWSRIAIAIFGVSLGPAIEELLFRGLLQPVMIKVAGVFPGILITSILFGAVHLDQNGFLWQSGVIITVAGFAFGTVRHVTGSTRASTITHIAYNSLPFLITVLQGGRTSHV